MRKTGIFELEQLDARELPNASAVLAAGVLTVSGSAGRHLIELVRDPATGNIRVLDDKREVARFDAAAVTQIVVNGGPGDDRLRVARDVTQPVMLNGDGGRDLLLAGGGPAQLNGGDDRDKIIGG